jgi:NADPH:quinone reductase-like Zn-dependent oxidoreductase
VGSAGLPTGLVLCVTEKDMTMGSTTQPAPPAGTTALAASGRVEGSESPNSESRDDVMRAIVQDAYGATDVLRLAEIDMPDIAASEVLVKVRAAGLDRGTWHLMTGQPYLMRLIGFGFRRPKNPVSGLDVAGTVVAVGSEVTRFKPGDEVFGIARGSFAEYAAAREDKLAHKPANLSFEQAAVVPISGSTALQGLRDAGRVEAGQKVLVIGASGGVGTYAVQLAKALGAQVTGVSSTAKVDLVRSIGADDVIDYTREDFADGSQRYDLILDIGGNSRLSRLRRALTPAGTLVSVGGEEGGRLTGGFGRSLRAPVVSLFVRQRLTMLASKEHHTYLEALRPFIEAGQVTPAIDKTYPLAEVPAAMRDLEAGHVRGKIAITI